VKALAVVRLHDVIGGALVIEEDEDVIVALLTAAELVVMVLNVVEVAPNDVLLDPRPDKMMEPTSVDEEEAGAEVALPAPLAVAVPDADTGRVQAPPS
jgi:hypothetical protein